MKNQFKNSMLFVFGLMILGMMSCDKSTPDPINPTGESISSVKDFMQGQRAAKTQNFTVDAGTAQTITGTQGTKINLAANSFYLNGSPVTGNIDVELIEAYDKGSMVLMGMTTMGKDWLGNYSPLISGGEFFFKASQNGQVLDIQGTRPQLSSAPFPTANFNSNMQSFILTADTSSADSVWTNNPDSTFYNCADSVQVSLGQSTYCFQFGDNNSWVNCDYFYNWGSSLSPITVNLPSAYIGSNTNVLISFDGLNVITGLYDSTPSVFSTGNGYEVPIGQAVNIILISEQNGVLEYAIIPTTISSNHSTTIVQSSISTTSAANLQLLLANLP